MVITKFCTLVVVLKFKESCGGHSDKYNSLHDVSICISNDYCFAFLLREI